MPKHMIDWSRMVQAIAWAAAGLLSTMGAGPVCSQTQFSPPVPAPMQMPAPGVPLTPLPSAPEAVQPRAAPVPLPERLTPAPTPAPLQPDRK